MKEITIQNKSFSVYLSQEDIAGIISNLANTINSAYEDKKDVILISILDGAFMFLADLVRELNFPHLIHFVKIRSYDDIISTGQVEYVLDLNISVKDKHVLVVEDIIDTGLTLESFMAKLKADAPASVKICTLLSKPDVHNDIVDVDFVGKEIPPEFIVGYGLDLNGQGRHLPDIYKLKI